MPKFITSIRLQGANEKDYAVLSREMKKNSFNPVLESKKNTAGGSDSTFVFNTNSNKSLVDTTTLVSGCSNDGQKILIYPF